MAGLRFAYRILALVLVSTFASDGSAGATDVRSHWSEGEERTYHHRMGIRSLGTHTARFIGIRNVPGLGDVCAFEMYVNLDMSPVGHDVKRERSCSLFCTLHGLPIRYVASYKSNSRTSSIDAVIRQGAFTGRADGLGPDSTFAIEIPPETYLCDNDFIAQWQMVFAELDLHAADTHKVDILVPEDLRRLPVNMVVTGMEPVSVGDETVECTVVRSDRVSYRFYVGPDNKLRRVVEPRQGLVIDLISSELGEVETVEKTISFWSTFPRRLLVWAIYAAWSAVFLTFLGRDGLGRLDFWLIFVAAGAVFGLVFVIQAPVQREMAKSVFTVIGAKGAGIYVGAFLTAFVSAIFQEMLKIAPVWLDWSRFEQKPKLRHMIALGAAAGAGFGFVESCWLIGGPYAEGHLPLLSPASWERLIMILFHVGTGVLLGYGVGRRKAWQYWLLAAGLHTVASFLVVFLRQGYVDAIVFLGFLTLYDLAVLIVGVAVLRRVQRR
jgi:hypothetical protein